MAIARKIPVTIVPIRSPPSISGLMIPTTIGIAIGMSAGRSMLFRAEPVTIEIEVA